MLCAAKLLLNYFLIDKYQTEEEAVSAGVKCIPELRCGHWH